MSVSEAQAIRVWIIDDEENLRHMMDLTLRKLGFEVKTFPRAELALEELKKKEILCDICLSDLRMPGMDGLTFIEQASRVVGAPVLIAMSAYGDEQVALSALKRGAFDYVSKPFTPEDLNIKLKLIAERQQIVHHVSFNHKSKANELNPFEELQEFELIFASDQMRNLIYQVDRVAPLPSTVLITGETGTGKERIASRIHAFSKRGSNPLIRVNSAAIPENLVESELFGHEKGSFTDAHQTRKGLFELASGGTLFLDEIAELPIHVQVKLLRALENQEIRRVGGNENIFVDVRLIAATSRNLEQMVQNKTFREDLYFRLNVVKLELPALRERLEDIPLLSQFFLARIAKQFEIATPDMDAKALNRLMRYPFPGNVRELQNAIERAVVMAQDRRLIVANDLDARFLEAESQLPTEDLPLGGDLNLRRVVLHVERKTVERALELANGNRRETARLLGVSERTLHNKLKEHELTG